MIVKDWLGQTLTPVAIGLDLYWPTRSAGEALGGDEQIGSSLSARWGMTLDFNIRGQTQVRAYRGIKAGLKGRYVATRFAICDPFRIRFVDADWPVPSAPIPFSDGTYFSDGTGFASPDVTTTVAAASALRSEEITLKVSTINDALGFGHFLSVTDPTLPVDQADWLYMVTGVLERSGNNRTFTIAPPLRAAASIDNEVRIGRPRGLFRLRDDMSGAAAFDFGRFGKPSMDFVEVMRRDSVT